MLSEIVLGQFFFAGKYFDAEITFVDVVVNLGGRFLLVDLGVSEHVPLEGEGLTALVALVGPLWLVSGLVLSEVAPVLESSVASLTLVGFVLTVGLQVTPQG